MAGYRIDENGKVVNEGGIDVGYLAATQPTLLAEGYDTEEEILSWYADEGQQLGVPANYNEQLAREAGYQGIFGGNGTWENEVEPWYGEGGAVAGYQPALVYTDQGWQVRGGSDTSQSYGAPATAPDSDVWLGGEALDDGWVYKNVTKDADLIATDAGERVLGGAEVFWDPDVTGSAAGAGYMDHRLIRQTQAGVRTADSNFDVDQTVQWSTFKDAPYNNFANFDAFVKGQMGEGVWNDYTPAERLALEQGENIGLGFKEALTGQSKKMGGYELTADQWATDVHDVVTRHVKGLKQNQADPGYWMGGSYGLAGMGKMLDVTAWGDNPNLDRYAIDKGPWSIGYRQTINRHFGRADMPVLPSDHAEYIADIQRTRGSNLSPEEMEAAFAAARERAEARRQERLAERRGDYEEEEPPPRPPREPEETNPSMSIFTNSSVGYPDLDLFRYR